MLKKYSAYLFYIYLFDMLMLILPKQLKLKKKAWYKHWLPINY